ncbi:MAG: hypothetical protein KDA62_02700 [Planctomycetales bacterium]|nr:hypothetical protein [Planctomycetales bacterium]
MTDDIDLLGMYLHLARASDFRRRPHVRDRFYVLAAAVATRSGLPRIAGACRTRVLEHNGNHVLRNWPTMADAMRAVDFQPVLRLLERRYPRERAEQLLDKLGLDLANERAAYFTDEEYAAALLGLPLIDGELS